MAELNFQIEGAKSVDFAATPTLALKLNIVSEGYEAIHNIVLRCQLQIESTRRHYSPEQQSKLLDLFGQPDRWGQTLRTMMWTQTSVVVPAFEKSVSVDVPVPCSFDFNVAATKYFYALDDGEVPLLVLFSGTIFYSEGDALRVTQIPWSKEARYRLPMSVWRSMMDHYYPNTAWLCLQRDIFDRLSQYKMRNGIPTWEKAIENLLAGAEESVPQ